MMAGNVYSTYELAKSMAQERMKELECDIFICPSNYKSGKEFILKVRGDMMDCATYLYMLELPFNHRFKNKHNVKREANRLSVKLDKKIIIKRHTFEENGYNKFSHFSLCST